MTAESANGTPSSPERQVVFIDADNTLWETDAIFARAQLRLLQTVEEKTGIRCADPNRLEFVREVDQELALHHHAGLRYPPRLLANAIALRLAGESAAAAARQANVTGVAPTSLGDLESKAIELLFLEEIRHPPDLREGVRRGLAALHSANCLLLILTEGPRSRIVRTATHHGIEGLFDRVISSPKAPRLFQRVLRLTGHPKHTFMIGDQITRDIQPAQIAGLKTIYFPGGFRPKWETGFSSQAPDYRVDDFHQAASIILEANAANIGSVALKEQ